MRIHWILVIAIAVSAATLRAQNTVSAHDLDSKSSLSKQQAFADIVALAMARKDSLLASNSDIRDTGPGRGRGGADTTDGIPYPNQDRPGNVLLSPSGSEAPENRDPALKAARARALTLELESELQKVMTRSEIDSAVRSWNQLSSKTKLKTPSDYQAAIGNPSKRSDAIRALAALIERAKSENERADTRRLLASVNAELVLQVRRSDELTEACASLVLSRIALTADQAERMKQERSRQQIATKSNPVIQHLIDLASQPDPH